MVWLKFAGVFVTIIAALARANPRSTPGEPQVLYIVLAVAIVGGLVSVVLLVKVLDRRFRQRRSRRRRRRDRISRFRF